MQPTNENITDICLRLWNDWRCKSKTNPPGRGYGGFVERGLQRGASLDFPKICFSICFGVFLTIFNVNRPVSDKILQLGELFFEYF